MWWGVRIEKKKKRVVKGKMDTHWIQSLSSTMLLVPSFSVRSRPHLEKPVLKELLTKYQKGKSYVETQWLIYYSRTKYLITGTRVHYGNRQESWHSTKKPVTTMLTYPWKCTVLHCNHLGNIWKPLVLMTRHFDYCPSASEGDNQSVGSSAPAVSRCFPGGYNVKLYISRGRLAWWLLTFLHRAENWELKGEKRVCGWEEF